MIKSNKYKYKYNALEQLIPFKQINLGIHNKYEKEFKIYLCIYDILVSEYEKHPPFLRYLLERKDDEQNQISFPSINLRNESKYGFVNMINQYFQILLKKKNISFSNFIIDGFYNDSDSAIDLPSSTSEIYLFINASKMKLNLDNREYINFSNSHWLTTIHEIVNLKKIGNIQINKIVTTFFTRHYEFAFIQNELNNDYEIPITAYASKPHSNLEYTFVFGISNLDYYAQDSTSLYSNFYYFTDYEKAIKDTVKLKEVKKGIIRFALFTGKLVLLEKESELLEIELKENLYDCIQTNNENNHSIYLIKKTSHEVPIPISFHFIT